MLLLVFAAFFNSGFLRASHYKQNGNNDIFHHTISKLFLLTFPGSRLLYLQT